MPIVVFAQTSGADTRIRLSRLSSAVVLDGFSNEPAWQGVVALPLVMHLPRTGVVPRNRGDVRFAFDDEAVYVAARLSAPSRSNINGFSLHRDRATAADDYLRVLFDSFNDREHGLVFGTTPTGIRVDYAIARDGADVNYDWNGQWDAAVAVTDSGWFVEMRIPLRTLRFHRDADGLVLMGVTVARYSAQDNETDTYPALSTAFSNATLRPSLAQRLEIGVRDVAEREITATPYVTAGTTSDSRRVDGSVLSAGRVGLDLKTAIASNVTLDLTANPDFEEAEADDHLLNLTRFPLFVREKRPFFQERAGVFQVNTGLNDESRLFHSRRIGLTPAGETVPIRAGARGVGRIGGWDFAALAVQTDFDSTGTGGTFSVARVRREIDDRGSTFGAIVTSQLDRNYHNIASGIDGTLRIGSNDIAIVQVAQSSDSKLRAGSAATMFRASVERPSLDGFGYSAAVKRAGSAFFPALGFEPRPDMTQFAGSGYYGWSTSTPRFWRQLKTGVEAAEYRRNEGFALDSRVDNAYALLTLSSGATALVEYERPVDVLPDTLRISDAAYVPPGQYSGGSVITQISTAPSRHVRGVATITRGTLYDAQETVVNLAPVVTVSRFLELSAELERRAARFASRKQSLDGDFLRLRVDAAANTRLDANLYAQYSRADRVVLLDGRVRINFGEGRDVFLVYRESDELAESGIFAPRSARQRRLLLKVTDRLGIR